MEGGSLLAVLEVLTGRRDKDGQPLGPRREETRHRIVEAAAAILLERGYREMRVDDVADGAAVTRPTLYAYFRSKGELLIAAMAEETLGQLAGIAPLFDVERPAEERLRDWIYQGVLYVEQAPLHARLVRDQDPDAMHVVREHELAKRALGMNPDLDKARLFVGLIQQAFPATFSDDEAAELASLLRALGHMAPSLLDETARFGLSVERIGELLSDLVIEGMRARSR